MSYVQIRIGPLQDGAPDSNLRELKFNQYAHIIIQEKIDHDHPTASINTALIFGGLKGNCYAKSIEPDFTFEDISDWIELITEEDILSAYNTYMSCVSFIKAKENQDKKKEQDLLNLENTDQNVTGLAVEN